MNENQVMHAMGLDDAYHVERVTIDGCGPFVRKKIPLERANRGVWARLSEAKSDRLPRVAATYEMPDQFVTVYDYIPGSILEETVRSAGVYPAGEAVTLALEICSDIEALHECGVAHLDLAPGNIVIAADGAHIIDFGLSRVLSEPARRTSRPLGTWGFAAPEQCGFGTTDERTDIYAIGKLLAYLLVGECEGFDLPSFDIEERQEVPAWLRAVVARACRMEPSQRYQSAAELAAALRAKDAGVVAEDAAQGQKLQCASRDKGVTRPGKSRARKSDGNGSARAKRTASKKKASSGSSYKKKAGIADAAGAGRSLLRGKPFVLILIAICLVMSQCEKAEESGYVPSWFSAIFQKKDSTPTETQSSANAQPSSSTSSSDSSASASVSTTDPDDVLPPEIVESGYTISDDGYVYYGVALKNPNKDALILYPSFRVTGYAKDGSILFSDEVVRSELGAGETHWCGGQAGDGTAPDRVEITSAEPGDHAIDPTAAHTARFKVESISATPDDIWDLKVSGKVTKVDKGSYDSLCEGAAITIILRDEDGRVVYGDMAYIDALSEGATSPFTAICVGAPHYKTIEAYACAN